MSAEYPIETVEVQWRVIWFPSDRPDQTFTSTEEKVRQRAALPSVAEWNPIIERREIKVGLWEPVP